MKNPYPIKSPHYGKFRRLLLQGKTYDEAVEVMKTWVPRGKNGYRRPDPQGSIWSRDVMRPGGEKEPAVKDDLAKVVSVLEKIAVSLEEINKSLHKPYTHLHQIVPDPTVIDERVRSPETPQPPKEFRTALNGWAVGAKVKRASNGDVGTITRIMAGRHDVEVRFLVGTKTLSINELVGVK